MATEDKKTEFDPMILSVLSYIGILVLIPFIMKPSDVNTKFHVRQGLTLLIAELITIAIGWFPLIGWVIGFVASLLWIALSLYGIYNVFMGRRKQLPVIGQYADKIGV